MSTRKDMKNLKTGVLISIFHTIIVIVTQNNRNAPLQRIVEKHLLNVIIPSPMAGACGDNLGDLANDLPCPREFVQNKTFLENASGNDGHFQDIVGSPEKGGNGCRLTRSECDRIGCRRIEIFLSELGGILMMIEVAS
jgi:hypothetical protein